MLFSVYTTPPFVNVVVFVAGTPVAAVPLAVTLTFSVALSALSVVKSAFQNSPLAATVAVNVTGP